MSDYGDPSDEYLGIASGFLFAGSRSILSTQWAVKEGAAALLIENYYLNLHRLAPASALAAAQRRLRRASRSDLVRLLNRSDELDKLGVLDARSRTALQDAKHSLRELRLDYSHPVYWAAFTVTGLHETHPDSLVASE